MMTMMFHDDVFDGEVFHDDYNLDGIGDYDKKIQVGTDSEGEIDEIFFIWPTTLVTNIPSGKVQKNLYGQPSCNKYVFDVVSIV